MLTEVSSCSPMTVPSAGFACVGSAGGAGWRVRYFDSLNPTNDVTSWFTGPGWTNVTLALNASREFRAALAQDPQFAAARAALAHMEARPK